MTYDEHTTEWYVDTHGIAHGTSITSGEIWSYCGSDVTQHSARWDTKKCRDCLAVQEALGRGHMGDVYPADRDEDEEEDG